jgi:hypothetical protein
MEGESDGAELTEGGIDGISLGRKLGRADIVGMGVTVGLADGCRVSGSRMVGKRLVSFVPMRASSSTTITGKSGFSVSGVSSGVGGLVCACTTSGGCCRPGIATSRNTSIQCPKRYKARVGRRSPTGFILRLAMIGVDVVVAVVVVLVVGDGMVGAADDAMARRRD